MSRAPDDTTTPEITEIEADNKPAVTVRHRSSHTVSRRRFLSGSLAIGGSALLGSGAALAADCDRNPEQVERCSDAVSYTHLPSPRDLSTSRMPSSA